MRTEQSVVGLVVILVIAAAPAVASAQTLYLSTTTNETLGGDAVVEDNVFTADTSGNVLDTAAFNGIATFDANENVDAFAIQADGDFIFSTSTSGSSGGASVSWTADDIVEFDPDTSGVSVLINGADYNLTGENLDAVHQVSANVFIISSSTAFTPGTTTFDDGDLVQLDISQVGADNQFSLILDEDNISGDNFDINAVSVNPANGRYLISFDVAETVDGTLYQSGDIIEVVDITGGSAVGSNLALFVAESSFNSSTGGITINALALTGVPTPATLPAGLVLLGFAAVRRNRRTHR